MTNFTAGSWAGEQAHEKGTPPFEPLGWLYTRKDGRGSTVTDQPPDRVSDLDEYEVTPLYKWPESRFVSHAEREGEKALARCLAQEPTLLSTFGHPSPADGLAEIPTVNPIARAFAETMKNGRPVTLTVSEQRQLSEEVHEHLELWRAARDYEKAAHKRTIETYTALRSRPEKK
jgi:hypothetical protein